MLGDLVLGKHALDLLVKNSAEIATFGNQGPDAYARFYYSNETTLGYITGVFGNVYGIANACNVFPTLFRLGDPSASNPAQLEVLGGIACSNILVNGANLTSILSTNLWQFKGASNAYLEGAVVGLNTSNAQAWMDIRGSNLYTIPALRLDQPKAANSSDAVADYLVVTQDGKTTTPLFLISSNNYVGIGTSFPRYLLDLFGNINVGGTGAYYACNELVFGFTRTPAPDSRLVAYVPSSAYFGIGTCNVNFPFDVSGNMNLKNGALYTSNTLTLDFTTTPDGAKVIFTPCNVYLGIGTSNVSHPFELGGDMNIAGKAAIYACNQLAMYFSTTSVNNSNYYTMNIPMSLNVGDRSLASASTSNDIFALNVLGAANISSGSLFGCNELMMSLISYTSNNALYIPYGNFLGINTNNPSTFFQAQGYTPVAGDVYPPKSALPIFGSTPPTNSSNYVQNAAYGNGSYRVSASLNLLEQVFPWNHPSLTWDGNTSTYYMMSMPASNVMYSSIGHPISSEWIDLTLPAPIYLNSMLVYRNDALPIEYTPSNVEIFGSVNGLDGSWASLGQFQLTSNNPYYGALVTGALTPYSFYRFAVKDTFGNSNTPYAVIGELGLVGTSNRPAYPTSTAIFNGLSAFGINTTTPQYTLDIRGDLAYTGALFNGAGSQVMPWNVTPGVVSMMSNEFGVFNRSVYITNALVGIGTDKPESNLHVEGDGLFTGTVYATAFKQIFSFDETLVYPPYQYTTQAAQGQLLFSVCNIPGVVTLDSESVYVHVNGYKYGNSNNNSILADYTLSTPTYNSSNDVSAFNVTFANPMQQDDVFDVIVWNSKRLKVRNGTKEEKVPTAPVEKVVVASAGQTTISVMVSGGDFTNGSYVVQMHVNGRKIAYISNTLNDYLVSRTFDSTNTTFDITVQTPLNAGDVVSATVWATQSINFGSSTLYKAFLTARPVSQTHKHTGGANFYTMTKTGAFAYTNSASAVYVNGIKLIEGYDYNLLSASSDDGVQKITTYTIVFNATLQVNDVVDMTVWPIANYTVGFAGEITDNNKNLTTCNAHIIGASNMFVSPPFKVTFAPTSLDFQWSLMAYSATSGMKNANMYLNVLKGDGSLNYSLYMTSVSTYFPPAQTYQLFPTGNYIYKLKDGIPQGSYTFTVELTDVGTTFNDNTVINYKVSQSTMN